MSAKDKLRRLVDIAKEAARLEMEGEAIISELGAPVQRRQAPAFERPGPALQAVLAEAADPRQLTVPGAETAPGTTLADRIAGMLQASPSGISIDALVQATGARPKSVRATLSVLKTRGRASVVSRGVWGP